MLRSLTLCITSVSGIHEPFLPHIWMLVCTYSSIKDRSRFFVNPCFDCVDRERLSEISCLTLQICIQHLDYIADLMNWYNAVGILCSKFQSCSCWWSKWLLFSAMQQVENLSLKWRWMHFLATTSALTLSSVSLKQLLRKWKNNCWV